MTSHNYNNFQVSRDERGVVTVTLDARDRPVNVFDEGVLTELETIVEWLEQQSDVKVAVFRSGKESGFLAGADVKRIASIGSADEASEIVARGQALFDRLERLPVPTVAVIHGPCLGGGLEFALACRHRIARDDSSTRLGLPEVQLGLLPAWGGTQRLPRLVGLVSALSMILKGSKLSARKALKLGLVDRAAPADEFATVIESFVAQLLKDPALVAARRRPSLVTRLLNKTRAGRWLVFRTTRRQIASQAANYPALGEALEAVRRGVQVSRTAGLAYEREAFARLLFTPTCRNLLALFFQRERARNVSTWIGEAPEEPSRKIERIGVVGAGAMGAGIAQLAAYRGLPVVVKEIDGPALEAGMARIGKLFDEAVRAGRLPRGEADKRLALLTPTTDWKPLAEADLVVEAVVEREEVKRHVFEELERQTRPDAILATNTSSLSVRKLAEAVASPERVAGLHFFNPVHRMELVEVVRTDQTSETVVGALVRLVRRLGKTPIVVKDSPGFLVNRILFPYLTEAVRLACEGVDVRTVDRQMRRFGMPMGPLELLDQVGLDIAAHVAESLAPAAESDPAAQCLARMVASGWLGKKSGRGFYEYQKGRRGRPSDRGQLPGAERPAETVGLPDPQTIEHRLVLPIINESARCLQEGIVEEAWMVDLAMVLGTGFAPFRGGPLRLADQWGIGKVVSDLGHLQERYGERFAPCERLKEMEQNESRFYEEPVRAERPLAV